MKYRVGVRPGIDCLMGRKFLSALGGSLSRDVVSVKTLVGGNLKTASIIVKCQIKKLKLTALTALKLLVVKAPGTHKVPDPASAGHHQATDKTKERMKWKRQ